MLRAIVQAISGVVAHRAASATLAAAVAVVAMGAMTDPGQAQDGRERVSPIERKAYVTEIQHQLKRLGCYQGAADGRLDRDTLAAIERLRSAVGRRQFARYELTSLSRRASTITESQFEAWVRRLRATSVRCESNTAKREAERGTTTRGAAPRDSAADRSRSAASELAARERAAREEADRARQRSAMAGRSRPYVAPPAASGPTGGSAPTAPGGAGRSGSAPATSAPEASAPPPTRGAATRSARSGGAAAPKTEPYDVVPIFYGTDRLREDNSKRAVYGSTRAKRLELGQALVTVPKVHEKPQVERPWVYRLPFTSFVVWSEKEDPARHFTIRNARHLPREQFIELVKQRLGNSSSYKDHALVFIHGFNTTFDWALYRAAQISYDLKFDGAMFAYSFPSRGEISPTAYAYDRESVGQSQVFLEEFLNLVARETGAKTVSIIAHSMGNQLLLPVLKDLKRSAPPGLVISQVILAAPDVDRDNFEQLARQITGISKGFTLYAAGNDWALKASQKFWGDVPRAGEVPAGGPIVVDGIDTIDVTKTSTEFLSLGHNGYAEKSALLNDIELLIRTGERPPEQRFPILKREATRTGSVYWRYP